MPALIVAGCVYDWEKTWVTLPSPPDAGHDAPLDAGHDAPLDTGVQDSVQDSRHEQQCQLDGGIPQGDGPVRIASACGHKVTCTGYEIAVSGGGECPSSSELTRSLSPKGSPKTWEIKCTSGSPVKTYVVCLDTSMLSAFQGSADASIKDGGVFTICSKSGYWIVGGGCDCGDKTLVKSFPDDNEGVNWTCGCEAAVPTHVTGVCMKTNEIIGKSSSTTTSGSLKTDCQDAGTALSGGCKGNVTATIPDANGFTCVFSANSAGNRMTWVLCVKL